MDECKEEYKQACQELRKAVLSLVNSINNNVTELGKEIKKLQNEQNLDNIQDME